MGLTVAFDTAYYTGTSSSAAGVVPHPYPVAIDGRPYLVDDGAKFGDQHTHQTIPYLRPYLISQDTLGEKTINPESLWRSSQVDWRHGAGQTHLDKPDSDTSRFRWSKGVDVWTRGQLSLLPDTTPPFRTSSTNLALAVAGAYVYLSDGTHLRYSLDLTAWTAVTGTPATAITGVKSDGYNVWAAYTSNGLWTTTRGAAAATQLVTDAVTIASLGYVKGRLMCSVGPALYNVTSTVPAALPAALFTHPNPDWTWVGYADGDSCLYAAGFSGSRSLIYRTAVKADGTALDAPVVAGELPTGEIVRSIYRYAGLVFIGTDTGVRVAQPQSSGDLQIGALIPAGVCRCFTGWGEYVWFGWEAYDATSTGLGRLAPTIINDGLAPAYASDRMMLSATAAVTSVIIFNGTPVFTVSGMGVYKDSTSRVPSGVIQTGLITYDLPDLKTALYLDVKHADPLTGSHSSAISVDGGTYLTVGTHTPGGVEAKFTLNELRGDTFEIQHTLTRSATDLTVGPTVYRWTLEAQPAVDTGCFITVPLILDEKLTVEDRAVTQNPAVELAYLKTLRQTQDRVVYQEGDTTYSVVVVDLDWHPLSRTQNENATAAWNGTCIVKLKTI